MSFLSELVSRWAQPWVTEPFPDCTDCPLVGNVTLTRSPLPGRANAQALHGFILAFCAGDARGFPLLTATIVCRRCLPADQAKQRGEPFDAGAVRPRQRRDFTTTSTASRRLSDATSPSGACPAREG